MNNSWKQNTDREMIQRALNTSNAGSSLLQEFVNRTVQQLTLREFGIQAVLERKEGVGQAELINQRAAGTTGGEWVEDSDSVTEENGTYSQVSFTYKSLVTRGKVTRKLQATGKSYADILALEMSAKAEDFANQLEFGFIQGDTAGKISGGSGGLANTKICNGFITLIQNVGTLDQVVSNAGATTANASLVLSKLDQAIDLVKGSAQRGDLAIIGSFAGIRAVNDALQSQQVFNDVTEIKAGFRVRTYDGIPLIVSTEVPNNFAYSTAGLITNNNSDGTCLLILNTRYCYIAELTPTTVMPLSKTSSQFDQFDMYWDGAPVLANTKGAAMLSHLLV